VNDALDRLGRETSAHRRRAARGASARGWQRRRPPWVTPYRHALSALSDEGLRRSHRRWRDRGLRAASIGPTGRCLGRRPPTAGVCATAGDEQEEGTGRAPHLLSLQERRRCRVTRPHALPHVVGTDFFA
jgi:hypothetical protein